MDWSGIEVTGGSGGELRGLEGSGVELRGLEWNGVELKEL